MEVLSRAGRLILLSLVVQLSLLYAAFHVYYTSPLVEGLSAAELRPDAGPPPAKRLVLFVADGLRAQSFYSLRPDGSPRAPFLFAKAVEEGSWGVSHTRVPTESRPGHVALIAGFYEDVSAVGRGWSENPVPFDSLFNRSSETWSWGSPDILPMFSRGAVPGRVHTRTYPAAMENFGAKDPSELDTWVFEEFHMHLRAAKEHQALREALSQDRVVFFLHLLGIDTSGHGYKPHSRQYLEGIAVVDEGVRAAVAAVEAFFGDERTAYVFTADHGMTDWGSHGAGGETETMTPLVAWGPGVRRPKPALGAAASSAFHVGPLEGLERRDVEQIDLAPFMASLIGAAIPANSVGQVPEKLLSLGERFRFGVLEAAWRQMLAQYQGKRRQCADRALKMLFKDFAPLSQTKIARLTAEMEKVAGQGRVKVAGDLAAEWIPVLRQGFLYFHAYDRAALSALVAAIFAAFLALLSVLASRPRQHIPSAAECWRLRLVPWEWSRVEGGGLAVVLVVAWLQAFSLTALYYVLLLGYLLSLLRRCVVVDFESLDFDAWKEAARDFFLRVALCTIGSGCVVLVFFHHWLLSLLLVAGALWGVGLPSPDLPSAATAALPPGQAWAFACLLNALFPLLPTIGQDNNATLALLGPGLVTLGGLGVEWRWEGLDFGAPRLRVVQLCVLGLAVVLGGLGGGGSVRQPLGWALLGASPLLALLSRTTLRERLGALFLALYAPYTLMSLSHETLFLPAFAGLLVCWLRLEASLQGPGGQRGERGGLADVDLAAPPDQLPDAPTSDADLRRGFFFLALLLLGFFGTGNVASLNSFDPSFTRCLVSVFDPFVMAPLLFGKVVTPLVLVCAAWSGLEVGLGLRRQWLLYPLLVFSDIAALMFFFLLVDEGSWLAIGTSISHYVIALGLSLVALLLLALSRPITCQRLTIPQNFGIRT